MRKLAVAVSLAVIVALSQAGSAATPAPVFVGTWIVSQAVSLPEGATIPLEPLSIPEFMHVDSDNEIRVVSGLFHPTSRGTSWGMGPFRDLVVPVNAGMGIGDWTLGENGEVIFTYHLFLFDGSNKPVGYACIIRTLAVAIGDLKASADPSEDVLTGSTTVRFFDLSGKTLSLRIGPFGMPANGFVGSFRAVRAAVSTN
jgi:hypothetical protein